MINIQEIFQNKRLDAKKLPQCGFAWTGNCFEKSVPILAGQFCIKIMIGRSGAADYRVFDAQTGEEYVLARVPDAAGSFVGEVHAACEEVLSQVARECFFTEHFQNGQTRRVLEYCLGQFGAEPEYLWKRYPDFAVLRVQRDGPWFALIGKVEKRKFGLSEDGFEEVINLKNQPDVIASRIAKRLAYAAYHMNKKYWFSTFLDGSLPDAELLTLIGQSYRSVAKGLH